MDDETAAFLVSDDLIVCNHGARLVVSADAPGGSERAGRDEILTDDDLYRRARFSDRARCRCKRVVDIEAGIAREALAPGRGRALFRTLRARTERGHVRWIPKELHVDRAVAHLERHAGEAGMGRCAEYVTAALVAAGLPYLDGDAKDLHAELEAVGFRVLMRGAGTDMGAFRPEPGDVVVFDAVAPFAGCPEGHRLGHTAMYGSDHWISDFHQEDRHFIIWADVREAGYGAVYTIYRARSRR